MRDYGISNAQALASAPAVGLVGDTYYNTTTKTMYASDGTAWQPITVPILGSAGRWNYAAVNTSGTTVAGEFHFNVTPGAGNVVTFIFNNIDADGIDRTNFFTTFLLNDQIVLQWATGQMVRAEILQIGAWSTPGGGSYYASTRIANLTALGSVGTLLTATFVPSSVWNSAWGEMDYKEAFVSHTGIGTTTTDVNGMSSSRLYLAGRKLRFTFHSQLSKTTAGDVLIVLADGANTVLTRLFRETMANGAADTCDCVGRQNTNPGGTLTFKVRANAVAGTMDCVSAALVPTYLLVEDMGAV